MILTAVVIRAADAQIVTQEVVLKGGGHNLLCWDLETSNGAPIVWTSLVGTQLNVNGTQAFIWSLDGTGFVIEAKGTFGWSPGSTSVRRGAGFFVKLPAGPDVTFRMIGWTPTQEVTTLANITATNAIGYPYPQEVAWTSTTLAAQSPPGTVLLTWDSTNQSFTSYMCTRSGWLNAGSLTLQPGQGILWNCASSMTWTVTRPY